MILTQPTLTSGLVHSDTANQYADAAARRMQSHSAITNTSLHTLGSISLSTEERALLSRGLRFIPTPRVSRADAVTAVDEALPTFIRSSKLADFFALYGGGNPPGEARPRSSFVPEAPTTWVPKVTSKVWLPPRQSLSLTTALSTFQLGLSNQASGSSPTRRVQDNLSATERAAVTSLSARHDLVLRDADKGMGLCAISTEFYGSMLGLHLKDSSTYHRVEQPPATVLAEWSARTKVCLMTLLRMTESRAEQALASCALPRFYVMPKLHKMSVKSPFASRPITAAFASPTRCISDILVELLSPLIADDGWTLSSSYDFIRMLEGNQTPLPASSTLVSMDVEQLYPSMRVDLCIRFTVERFCEFYQISSRSSSARTLGLLLRFLLTDNWFIAPGFKSNGDASACVFTQVSGIAMGVSVAVILANVYCRRVLAPVIDRFAAQGRLTVFWRRGYVDDLTMAVNGPDVELHQLIAQLNGACPGFRLTCECSPSQVQFLDVVISKGTRWLQSGGTLLDTRVFTKPGNLHLYIPFSSAHPQAALSGFIAGEARRFVQLCTAKEDALSQSKVFANALVARGYPLSLVVKQLASVQYERRAEYLRLVDAVPEPAGAQPEVSPPATAPLDPESDVESADSLAQAAPSTHSRPSDTRRVALVLPYSPSVRDLRVGPTLHDAFRGVDHIRPVVAWRNSPNLQGLLRLQWPKV